MAHDNDASISAGWYVDDRHDAGAHHSSKETSREPAPGTQQGLSAARSQECGQSLTRWLTAHPNAAPPAVERTYSLGGAVTSAPEFSSTIRIADRYQLLGPIGSGGQGTVFKALDLALGRYVALKLMHAFHTQSATARERFRREIRQLAGLDHPNIVPVYDGGECPFVGLFLVMMLVEGETLKTRLAGPGAKYQPLDIDSAIRFACDLAEGMAYLHAVGMMHRDGKPSNVLLTSPTICRRSRAIWSDFGLSRVIAERDRLTGDGVVVGTPGYMSPEQETAGVTDHRTDMYSFGVLCWEMLVGGQPFGCSAHEEDPTARIAPPVSMFRGDAPRELSDLIDELMRPDPNERPDSMEKVARQLRGLLE